MLEVHKSNEVSTLEDTSINTMSKPLDKSIIKKDVFHSNNQHGFKDRRRLFNLVALAKVVEVRVRLEIFKVLFHAFTLGVMCFNDFITTTGHVWHKHFIAIQHHVIPLGPSLIGLPPPSWHQR